jgi:hypothetical protein
MSIMHPEMANSLAAQHRHDLTSRSLAAGAAGQRHAAGPRGPRRFAPGAFLPHYRLSWSRTTLSPAAEGGRRGRSYVIVISATRPL